MLKKLLSFIIMSICIFNFEFTKVYASEPTSDLSEILYTKIYDFLDNNKNCLPENFENKCIKYMTDNNVQPTYLEQDKFKEFSTGNIILYRGLTSKKYAQEFLCGNIYIGKNINNVRGNGIYTTSNEKCAKLFAENNGAILKMFLNKEAKILEYSDFKEIINSMAENHSEIKNILEQPLTDALYDSLSEYINDKTKNISSMDDLRKICELMQSDPEYIELNKSRKKYFKDNLSALVRNSGLLIKLLGYDVLHVDEFDEELGVDIQEYLVLNSGVLTVCNTIY